MASTFVTLTGHRFSVLCRALSSFLRLKVHDYGPTLLPTSTGEVKTACVL
jgi:hypothetical protein